MSVLAKPLEFLELTPLVSEIAGASIPGGVIGRYPNFGDMRSPRSENRLCGAAPL